MLSKDQAVRFNGIYDALVDSLTELQVSLDDLREFCREYRISEDQFFSLVAENRFEAEGVEYVQNAINAYASFVKDDRVKRDAAYMMMEKAMVYAEKHNMGKFAAAVMSSFSAKTIAQTMRANREAETAIARHAMQIELYEMEMVR